MKNICLIPARFNAERFPGKLLQPLFDTTVINYTYKNICSMDIFDYVAVVTNSIEIKNEIESDGGAVIYLPNEHSSGTDRIAEALLHLEGDIIVNVQGDEPFVKKQPLLDLVEYMAAAGAEELKVASLMYKMDNVDNINSSDFVKVVCDKNNNALYFSRSVIPFRKKQEPEPSYYEHIGVYAFTRASLLAFANMPATELEQIESIECLRFLENNIPIKMIESREAILEIDTPEDLLKANSGSIE